MTPPGTATPPSPEGSPRSTAPARRRALLDAIYGPDVAADVDAELARLIAATAPRSPTPPLDERSAWVIAYPDHVTEPGRAPLATLADTVARRLAPEVTGVHTLPLHPSSGDGGFSVQDPHRVDPAFGDADDVRRLAAGTTWMADAVVNHLSASSPWFTGFLAGEEAYAGFFRTLDPAVDVSAVVRPRTTPLSHRYDRPGGGTADVWTTFSRDQVDLDYREPRVLVAMVEVLLRYVALGARAIRLDAVGFLWKDPATPSIHLPHTHRLVQLFRACLDAVDPGLVLVTETNVPHDENVSYLGLAGEREAQAVYQFALPPLVLHSIATGSAAALAGWARRPRPPGGERTFLNFLASHDGIGLRAAEGILDEAEVTSLATLAESAGGVVNHRTATDGSPVPYELAVSWFELMSHGQEPDAAVRRHLAAHAVALCLAGVPLLYLNSLVAASNDTGRYARTGHARDLNRRRYTTGELAAALADPAGPPARVLRGLRGMLRARWASPAFSPDADQVVHDAPDEVLVVERVPATGPRAVVAVNVSGRPVALGLPAGRWSRLDVSGREPDEAPGAPPAAPVAAADPVRGAASGEVALEPWGHAWFVEA